MKRLLCISTFILLIGMTAFAKEKRKIFICEFPAGMKHQQIIGESKAEITKIYGNDTIELYYQTYLTQEDLIKKSDIEPVSMKETYGVDTLKIAFIFLNEIDNQQYHQFFVEGKETIAETAENYVAKPMEDETGILVKLLVERLNMLNSDQIAKLDLNDSFKELAEQLSGTIDVMNEIVRETIR